jgi:Predicted ATPase (AAA+ superfamily)
MFERPQGQSLLARLNEPPRFIQILAGPRQVGKTTLINQVLSKFRGQSVYAQADLPVPPTAQWIEQQWQRALMANPSSDQPVVLVLDEVQKVPRWSDVVKSLWDTRPDGLSLVLLGSSQFLMQSGLNESLMGRFEVIHLPHWSLTEMQSAFGFT